MIFNLEEVCLGKKAAKPIEKLMPMREHFLGGMLPTPPNQFSWRKGIRSWGMMLNNDIGDCTAASIGHMIQVHTLNATGIIKTPPDLIVEQLYEQFGFDPNAEVQDGRNVTDNGAELSDVVKYVAKNGFYNYSFHGFGNVDIKNENDLKVAVWLYGGMHIGLGLPLSIRGQSIWDVVDPNGQGDSKFNSLGGHAVYCTGYDENLVEFITWGYAPQFMTWNFALTYLDEAYVMLSNIWENSSTTTTPSGFSVASLEENMNNLD